MFTPGGLSTTGTEHVSGPGASAGCAEDRRPVQPGSERSPVRSSRDHHQALEIGGRGCGSRGRRDDVPKRSRRCRCSARRPASKSTKSRPPRKPISKSHRSFTAIRNPTIRRSKILQGRDLALRAVKRLKLETVPEFNGRGATPPFLTQVMRRIKAKITAPFRGNPGAARPGPVQPATPNQQADAFLGRIQVVPVRGSRLVDVYFVSADPQFAARAVNVVAEEYVNENLEFRLSNTDKTLQWLTEEVAKQQNVVQASERMLAEYRENQNALSLEDRQNIIVSRLNQVNDAASRARTTRIQKEALYNQVVAAKDREGLTMIAANPFVQQLKTRIVELQRDQVRLQERYGDKHPDVQRVNGQIIDAQRQLDAEIDKSVAAIKSDYQAALDEEKQLARDLEGQKGQATDLNRKSIDYSVLQREAESNRQVYESLLQREKELRVVSNSRANNVRLLDSAEVRGRPSHRTRGARG